MLYYIVEETKLETLNKIHCDCCGHEEVDWMPFVKVEDKIYCGICITLGIGFVKEQHEKYKEKHKNDPFIPPNEDPEYQEQLMREFDELLQEAMSWGNESEEQINIPERKQKIAHVLEKTKKPLPKTPQICHLCNLPEEGDAKVYQILEHKLCNVCIRILYEHWLTTVERKKDKPPTTH
jgi:hypothetical protein